MCSIRQILMEGDFFFLDLFFLEGADVSETLMTENNFIGNLLSSFLGYIFMFRDNFV